MNKHRVVLAIFKSRVKAEQAVARLEENSFATGDISVLMPEEFQLKDFDHFQQTKAPEGIATGAGAGVFLGGALGWLCGAGVLGLAGLAPFLAAGPVVAMFAGAGLAGTVGGIAGALIGLGLPEEEAQLYATRVLQGGILISVPVGNEEREHLATDLFSATGGQDISTSHDLHGLPQGLPASQRERGLHF